MNPRLLAYTLLQKAEKNGQFSNIALDKALEAAKLSDADAALASILFYGVIEKPEDIQGIKCFKEVPLGTGSVDFPAWMKALEDIGYRGYLTIEREVGENPTKDIKTAMDHLTRVIKEN